MSQKVSLGLATQEKQLQEQNKALEKEVRAISVSANLPNGVSLMMCDRFEAADGEAEAEGCGPAGTVGTAAKQASSHLVLATLLPLRSSSLHWHSLKPSSTLWDAGLTAVKVLHRPMQGTAATCCHHGCIPI
ncbi:hypothetical protein GW17_00035841 [Ensete ventricosum]|nr:hypothetical protein GW17_00035841 [Ensete ventricosum]